MSIKAIPMMTPSLQGEGTQENEPNDVEDFCGNVCMVTQQIIAGCGKSNSEGAKMGFM